jgi:hypothetical protein
LKPVSGALAALALLLCAHGARAADLPPPIYELKQAEASIGTNIPRRQIWGSKVPMNRRYDQLTPEEQASVKSVYEAMAPGDEPPYPADGLVPIFKAVRTVSDYRFSPGEVSIFVDVDEKGDAVGASIMKSPDAKMTAALANVLMLTKYKPAICGGTPCRMSYPFRITFSTVH